MRGLTPVVGVLGRLAWAWVWYLTVLYVSNSSGKSAYTDRLCKLGFLGRVVVDAVVTRGRRYGRGGQSLSGTCVLLWFVSAIRTGAFASVFLIVDGRSDESFVCGSG